MRKKLLGLAIAGAFLAPVAAGAATLTYDGTLEFKLATLPGVVAEGFGSAALVNGSNGGLHLSTVAVGTLGVGPVTSSVPVTSNSTINSVIFTGLANGQGTAQSISGGPPGSCPIGLRGTAKICLVFAPCMYAAVPVPLTPDLQGNGFGVGGTQTILGNVSLTMQHAQWTIGTPTVTIHSANTNVTVPTLPGGFAHGPLSGGQSSAANPSGVVQLVTVTKAYTSLLGAFPELPLIGVLQLQFVPEPGTLMLIGAGALGLAAFGRKMRK